MRIIIDAMGGDNAPEINVEGAIKAISKNDNIEITLVGDEQKINELLGDNKYAIEVVHASEVMEMDEDIRSVRKNKNLSINKAITLVKDGHGDALVSCGGTGGVLAASTLMLGRINGVSRPALSAIIPSFQREKNAIALDVGASVDSMPQHLVEFAKMGQIYQQEIAGINNPSVGLLNIGEEDKKGSTMYKEAFNLLDGNESINFIGNTEAKMLTNSSADVIVSDGFAGNVSLKATEGMAKTIGTALKSSIKESFLAKIGAAFLAKTLKKILKRFDPNQHGGAILLGLNNVVIKGHGSASSTGVENCILLAQKMMEAEIVSKIEASLAE